MSVSWLEVGGGHVQDRLVRVTRILSTIKKQGNRSDEDPAWFTKQLALLKHYLAVYRYVQLVVASTQSPIGCLYLCQSTRMTLAACQGQDRVKHCRQPRPSTGSSGPGRLATACLG